MYFERFITQPANVIFMQVQVDKIIDFEFL